MRFYKLSLLSIAILLLTSGCLTITGGGKQDTSGIDGGVFVSGNKGMSWVQKNSVPSISGQPMTLSGTNYSLLKMDPSDNKALYYGAAGNGLFYTYNGGDTWLKASGLGNITPRALDIDSNDKCNIFTSAGNKVFRTTDCSRTWEQVYVDNQNNTVVDAIVVDYFNGNNVYITISRGDLVKSADQGKSWQTVYRFKKRISKLIMDPNDSRILYAIIDNKEIFKSTDSGVTWVKFDEVLKEFKLASTVREILLFKDKADLMFLATEKGILRSFDRGLTWEQIKLIPPEANAAVEAVAVSPQDEKEIYYVAGNTFYRSEDGGENWTPSKVPTTRIGKKLIIDPEDPRIIYLAVWRAVK